MFQVRVNRSNTESFFAMLSVIYHTIVRSARSGHRSAVVAMALNMMRGLMLVAMFFVLFQVLGMRSSPIRGDMILFLISGVFMFMTHVQSVRSVAGAGSPLSAMLLHGPMNTMVAIISAAMATLYQQFITLCVVLVIYHCAFAPLSIHDPISFLGFFLAAWFSGCAVGMIFVALSPWFPRLSAILMQLYRRAQMIASGKMFVVNTLPASMVAVFDWNPLFHIIDQGRGALFLHYSPHVTSVSYPIYVSLTLVCIGLMGEFFARQHVSASWFAGR